MVLFCFFYDSEKTDKSVDMNGKSTCQLFHLPFFSENRKQGTSVVVHETEGSRNFTKRPCTNDDIRKQ